MSMNSHAAGPVRFASAELVRNVTSDARVALIQTNAAGPEPELLYHA